MRGEALAAGINNHAELMGLVANRVKRHGNESKNPRCSKYDDNVQFLFWLYLALGEQLLRQTDNLSRALQDSSTSAARSGQASDPTYTARKIVHGCLLQNSR